VTFCIQNPSRKKQSIEVTHTVTIKTVARIRDGMQFVDDALLAKRGRGVDDNI
jgi:hypothetical protein